MRSPAVLLIIGAALALQTADAQTFTGDGTYYGNNGWAGSCMGNIRWSGGVYDASSWPPSSGQFGTRFALNSRQYSTEMCGKRIMYRGTGQGLGYSPYPSEWREGMITNLCPECKYGDLDAGIGGDGRWKIEWYFLDGQTSVTASSVTTTKTEYTIESGLTIESSGHTQRTFAKSPQKKKPEWKKVWDRLKSQNTSESKAKLKRIFKKSRKSGN